MRIQSIQITDFLGLHAVDVSLRAPVALFCGANGAGKSSLRDAIALALTADLGRVSLKKEAPALIREGAEAAVCELTTADQDIYRVSISRSGKITDSQKGRDTGSVWPYVLDAQRLASLDATERRAFLFGLMGLSTDPASIRPRLAARLFAGRQPTAAESARMERIAPLLRAGFDAAHADAKSRATEAKGAWRSVTGETYGSEKGKTWRASVPPYDTSAAAELARQIHHADVAIGQWQQEVGKLQAEEQRRAQRRTKLPALQEHAAKMPRLQAKLEHDEKALQDASAELQRAQQAAGAGPRVGLVHDLARALRDTLFFVGEKHEFRPAWQAPLAAYEAEHGSLDATGGDHESRARLPELLRQHALMLSAVDHARRDLAAARQAHTEAKTIADELNETFDSASLDEARAQADTIGASRAALVKRSDELKSIKALIDAAEAKTEKAAQHHADVAAWDAIADALGPNGLPAEILAEALGPINERLAQSALDTQWPRVEITADMQIRTGLHEREYRLLSESERWRADAMLAEAVAHISGTRLLVLDRMDVLDLHGRSELLGWLDVLADAGEIDTALVFATLKAMPAVLPESISAHWLEHGVCAQLKEAA